MDTLTSEFPCANEQEKANEPMVSQPFKSMSLRTGPSLSSSTLLANCGAIQRHGAPADTRGEYFETEGEKLKQLEPKTNWSICIYIPVIAY